MNKQPGIIFDLDGTLYPIMGRDGTFSNSDFYQDLKSKMYRYLSDVLGISDETARSEYSRINCAFNGDVSIGVEKEFGISRYEWFDNTWSLDPANYIEKPTNELKEILKPVADRSLVLTAAPSAWAYPVLGFLGISDLFKNRVITGESDIRKPSTEVFRQAADMLQRNCYDMISVGDQNESDILPAKKLGMITIKVGAPEGDADYFVRNAIDAINLARSL